MKSHGPGHHTAKLDYDDVEHIRRLRAEGKSLRSIARQYGISHQAVHKIIMGYTWKVNDVALVSRQ